MKRPAPDEAEQERSRFIAGLRISSGETLFRLDFFGRGNHRNSEKKPWFVIGLEDNRRGPEFNLFGGDIEQDSSSVAVPVRCSRDADKI